MDSDIGELLTLKLECFECPYAHSCRYYDNSLWDYWMFEHPDEGCPARKYQFESLYLGLQKEALKKQKEKERRRADDFKSPRK